MRATAAATLKLASEVLELCDKAKLKLAVAESLTGGALSSALVDIPGASNSFLGSVIAYDSRLKIALLGVNADVIASSGAVDARVAAQMALGVRAKFAGELGLPPENLIAVSTTGVASPSPSQLQPVGKVFIGLALPGSNSRAEAFEFDFDGDRQNIREQAVYYALVKLREHFVK